MQPIRNEMNCAKHRTDQSGYILTIRTIQQRGFAFRATLYVHVYKHPRVYGELQRSLIRRSR